MGHTYLFHFSENSYKIEACQLLEVVEWPSATGEQWGEEGGILGHVFQANGCPENSSIGQVSKLEKIWPPPRRGGANFTENLRLEFS